MKRELLTVGSGAIELLDELARRSATGVPLTGMRGRLSDVAELLGLDFASFDSGTLMVQPRGIRFLNLATRNDDGSASVSHDDLGRDFKVWGSPPKGPKG